MTPAPRSPFSSGFPHVDAHAAQSRPVPTSPESIFQRYLLPPKKRATTASDGGSSADDSFVIPPKKRLVVDTGGEGTSSNGAIPVQSRPRRVAACNVAYVSMEEEEEAGTSTAGATAGPKRNRNSSRNKNGPRPARDATPLVNRPLHLSDAQQQHLKALGATAPQFVIMKTLQLSDVDRNQNRLLFSCKREFLEGHPITGILSEKETCLVHDRGRGLSVVAQDDHGNRFNFTLKYLDSNGGYRFIGRGWNDFVSKNKLVEPVKEDGLHFDVELWAFRSPELPRQPVVPGIEGLQGHPDGALGFLLRLHHDDSRDVRRGGQEEREFAPRPVQKKKGQAQAKAVRPKKLAGAHVSQGQAVARDVTRAEIVKAVGEEMADALFGLFMLKSSAPVPMPPFESTTSAQVC